MREHFILYQKWFPLSFIWRVIHVLSFLSVIICKKNSEQISNSYMTSFSYTIINPFSRFTTAMIIYWEWHYYTFMLNFLFYFFLYSHDRTMQDIVYKLVPNLQESKCLVRHQYIGLLQDSPQQLIIYFFMYDHIIGLSTATSA